MAVVHHSQPRLNLIKPSGHRQFICPTSRRPHIIVRRPLLTVSFISGDDIKIIRVSEVRTKLWA